MNLSTLTFGELESYGFLHAQTELEKALLKAFVAAVEERAIYYEEMLRLQEDE